MPTPLNFFIHAVLLQGRKLLRDMDVGARDRDVTCLMYQGIEGRGLDMQAADTLMKGWQRFKTKVLDYLENSESEAFIEVPIIRFYQEFREEIETALLKAA